MRELDILHTLRELLEANGINQQYTDTQLQAWITEATLLVNKEYTSNTVYEDYHEDYHDNIYLTRQYPIRPETVTVTLDNHDITEEVRKITGDGIIYFKKHQTGTLTVTYTVGLCEEDVENYILPIALYLIRDSAGQNLAGITEGDVSLTYYGNYGNTDTSSLDGLVKAVRDKYSSRVVFL